LTLFEGQVVKFLLTSFFAIFLLIAVYYLINKFNFYLPRAGKSRYIKLLEVLPVGKDFYLALVEVGEDRLLLAFTNSSVKLIKEFKVKDGDSDG
jgi:flagellar biosynthetic protein FliO